MGYPLVDKFLSKGFALRSDTTVILVFCSIISIAMVHRLTRIVLLKSRPPYPPGPPPRLIIGNSFDLPLERPWIKYMELGTQYNTGILYLQTPTDHIIILNSLPITKELLYKRSHIYSDRPEMPMLELTGWDFNVGLARYGDIWRQSRRIFQHYYSQKASIQYQPVQVKKVHGLLHMLLESPDEFIHHYRTASAAIIMSTVYGYEVAPVNDHFKTVAESAASIATSPFLPWAIAINTFPFLRYLPGTIFHRSALRCKRLTTEMLDGPFNFVRNRMSEGTSSPCLLADLLQKNSAEVASNEQDDLGKRIAATAYGAGADTTVSSLETFHFAMVMNPEVQEKGQLELDRVVGSSRLPDLSDRPSLPYVEAIYREVMRWRPALPLGVFHSTTQDDVYEGYHIPKGSIIFPNIWAMTRDQTKYAEPDRFFPERFLNQDGTLNDDDEILAFGFGRRLCVGRHMASATVWLVIAMTLATFKISKARDDSGKEIEVREEYSSTSTIHYKPYRCSIKPRNGRAVELIEVAA